MSRSRNRRYPPCVGYVSKVLRLRTIPGTRRIARELLLLYGCDIPPQVSIGDNVRFEHRGIGVVLHSRVTLGDRVTIYHGVTIGRAGVSGPLGEVVVEDDVIIGTGAVLLFGERGLRIGKGARIGANAVVLESIPAGETWVGNPARPVRGSESPHSH